MATLPELDPIWVTDPSHAPALTISPLDLPPTLPA